MEFDLTMLYLSTSYVVIPNLKLYHMPFIGINIIIIIIFKSKKILILSFLQIQSGDHPHVTLKDLETAVIPYPKLHSSLFPSSSRDKPDTDVTLYDLLKVGAPTSL